MPQKRYIFSSSVRPDFWERVTIALAFMFLAGPWCIGIMFLVYAGFCWGGC